MKIAVTGKDKEDVDSLKANIREYGFEVVDKDPNMVISFGGDGSFLYAERMYPGVPKLITRNKSICKRCADGEFKELMDRIAEKRYVIREYNKLKAVINKGKKQIERTATNDIIIRNLEQFHAIRFSLYSENKQINGEFIGDGVVAAGPFGSTGYYYSITKTDIKEGIGLALNNTTTKENHYTFKDKTIRFVLNRNSAGLSIDNDTDIIKLEPGDTVEISTSDDKSRVIDISE